VTERFASAVTVASVCHTPSESYCTAAVTLAPASASSRSCTRSRRLQSGLPLTKSPVSSMLSSCAVLPVPKRQTPLVSCA